ncbi:MAG: DUF2752 domain-containing protein [Prevotella sp.]|nr:DUF2752 domain-containing protein [Prevotella sp.]
MSDRIDRIIPYALPIVFLATGGFYYLVNPVIKHFPLQCVWRLLTGTQCPACGFQRAIHALVHGQFTEALSYNYFFVISIPFALIAILAEWYNYRHKLDFLRTFVHSHYTLKTYVVLYFVWWVMRNVLNV